MKRFLMLGAASLLAGCVTTGVDLQETVIESEPMARQLTGARPLTLQWISWDEFGEAVVKDKGGALTVTGAQHSRSNDDYLKIDGRITKVEARRFFFDGTIEIRVSHILDGKPYTREGVQEFFLYGDRGFWRLRDMTNAEGSVDYVDIYFDLPTAKKANAGW